MNRNRSVQYLAACAVSLAVMTMSASFFWTAPILPKFYDNEIIPNITKNEISWMVSIVSLGMVFGCFISSIVSDKYGRRTTLLASSIPVIIGTVLVLFATTAWMLCIARLLWGCGDGMVATVAYMYLSEIADKEIRGSLTAITRFMFSVGSVLMLSVGSYVSYQVLSSFLIVLPVCYLIACWYIPESPYYLLKQGKVDKARTALLKLSSNKDETMLEERLSQMRSDVRAEMKRKGSIKELFTGKQYRRALIITIGLRFTQITTGTIPIQMYLGRIMQQSNSGMSISTALVIFSAVRFGVGLLRNVQKSPTTDWTISGFIAPLVVDRFGRRPLLISTYSSASIVLASVGAYFFMQQVIGINGDSSSPFRHMILPGILISVVIAIFGFDTLVFVIPSEIFPLNVKSLALTFFNLFSAFVNFIAIRGYQIVEDLAGLYGVFWCYASMGLCGALFSYFLVFETKGKSLREIQIELQGNIYDECDEKLNKTEDIDNDHEGNTDLKQ